MANYVFLYSGGAMPEGEDEMKKMMDAWGKWYEEMGDAVVDPGNPFGDSVGVSSSGDGDPPTDAKGYTVVSADSIDSAKDLARKSPHLGLGGTIGVHETVTPGSTSW